MPSMATMLTRDPVAPVVTPSGVDEVVEAVRFAGAHDLRVEVRGPGRDGGAPAAADDALLLRTDALRGVAVDPRTGVARIAAGEPWHRVVAATGPGRAAPHGTSVAEGAAAWTLAGGVGWLARRHGLAANAVRAVELVTAAGEHVRADAEHHPEAFWALRGGGRALGVVTAIELALHPVTDLCAGALLFDLGRAPAVLAAWRAWTGDAPDALTSAVRLLRLPAAPGVPELLRGRAWCVVMAAVLARPAAADALVAPLRALGPEIDTFAPAAPAALARLAVGPPGPVAPAGAGLVLDGLPDGAAGALLELAGRGARDAPPLVELRHLGGALATPAPGGGALSALPGTHLVRAAGDGLEPALAPWAAARRHPGPGAAASARLAAVRQAMDPEGRFAG